MTNEIYDVGPSNVSKHLGDFTKLNVLDIDPKSVQNKDAFINSVFNNKAISKLLSPYTKPKDPSFHLEIPQKN